MWLTVLFDVPTVTSRDKREYRRLRQTLLDNGMLRLQYSVYTKLYADSRSPEPLIRAIEQALPGEGRVTVFAIPDRIYAQAYRFVGDRYGETEGTDPEMPTQLTIF